MSTEPLYTCPRCQQSGFIRRGLSAHVCRGPQPGDERRRLTSAETASAILAKPSHSSPFTPHSSIYPMSKTPTKALAVQNRSDLAYSSQHLPELQQALVLMVQSLERREGELADQATLTGVWALAVKRSMKHGQFGPWIKTHCTKIGHRQLGYYMQLAMVFLETGKVELPNLLSLPGDQQRLDLAGSKEETARRLFDAVHKFTAGLPLNELLTKHELKKAPKLGGARLPEGQDDDESADTPPADPEALAAQKREEISAWLAQGRALLVSENACQFLAADDQRSVLDGIDALRTDLRAALRHLITPPAITEGEGQKTGTDE